MSSFSQSCIQTNTAASPPPPPPHTIFLQVLIVNTSPHELFIFYGITISIYSIYCGCLAHFSPIHMIPYIWHGDQGRVGDVGPVGLHRSSRAACSDAISGQEGEQHTAHCSQQNGTTQHGPYLQALIDKP